VQARIKQMSSRQTIKVPISLFQVAKATSEGRADLVRNEVRLTRQEPPKPITSVPWKTSTTISMERVYPGRWTSRTWPQTISVRNIFEAIVN